MPRPDPPIHSRWKPGQSGNPGGKKKALITLESIREIIEKLALLTREQLQSLYEDPKTTIIELQFASIMMAAIKTGDYTRLNFILDRVVGKPVLTAAEETTINPVIITLPSNGRESA